MRSRSGLLAGSGALAAAGDCLNQSNFGLGRGGTGGYL